MKTYIWSLPTRLFHKFLFLGVIIAYLLGENDDLIAYHTAIGLFIGVLVLFRLIWGFIGPKYSRFLDFPMGLKSFKRFFRDIKNSRFNFAGHNPFASIVMMSILICTMAIVITGVLNLTSEYGGFASKLFIVQNSEFYEEAHEFFVNILIVLVIIHLLGLFTDVILHRKFDVVFSIFNGYKNIETEQVKLKLHHHVLSWIWFASAFAVLYLTLSQPALIADFGSKEKNDIEKYDDD